MNFRNRAGRSWIPERPARSITVAVVLALAGAGLAEAQTSPYTAPERYGVGQGIGQAQLPRGTVVQPRVEGAIQYINNLTLAEDGEPQVDAFGLEVVPGIYASYFSDAFQGAIDYSLIGRLWDESDYNDIDHRLAANGEWFAVPEWFGIRGQASYYDSVIDTGRSLNYGGLGIFGPSNLVEVATASVNPILRHAFNHFLVSAGYSYGRVWYLDEGKGQPTVGFVTRQDSKDHGANFSIGTADDARRLSGQVYYDWQRSEFERAIPYEYERTGISLGYLIGRSISLVGDYGWESDLLESTTQGGLDSEFWSVGLRWRPNDRTSVEARTGDRFFGNSYSFDLRHRARMLEFRANYAEEPMVQTRELSLGDFDPGDLPPGSPDLDFGLVNSFPYVSKGGSASVALVGSRTRVRLMASYQQRDYLTRRLIGQRPDEDRQYADFMVTRQLASNLTTDFSLRYGEFDRSLPTLDPIQPEFTSKDYDTRGTLRLNRETGDRLILTAEAGYLNRGGDRNYDGWWIGLRGRWSPYASAAER